MVQETIVSWRAGGQQGVSQTAEEGGGKEGHFEFGGFPFLEYLLGSLWNRAGMKVIDTAPILASR